MADVTTHRASVTASGSGAVLDNLATGQWFWVNSESWNKKEKYRSLACVVRIGSNYAKLKAPNGTSWRVHFDEFLEVCAPEPDADRVVQEHVSKHRQEAARLMAEVQDLTTRLAISPRPGLSNGSDAGSMALTLHSGRPVKAYKMELAKAQKETLPALFNKIGKETEAMAEWMKATLLPLEAQVSGMRPTIEAIESRIHNVELYAGLSEEVVEVRAGLPADIGEPLRLFQRRHYMDEECLARYEAGGMEFKDIGAFDAWLLRDENLERVLPFPRCVVSFRVRRHTKDREAARLSDFLRFGALTAADKTTFLYIRNGAQVHRLNTDLDFGKRLFPDMDRSRLDGVVYAKYFTSPDELVVEAEYEAEKAKFLAPDYDRSMRGRGRSKKELAQARSEVEAAEKSGDKIHLDFYSYIRWTPATVYYDDIAKLVQAEVEQHNRVVTVLQGLLDRSPVLHPHPAWQLWTPDGFAAAVRLVYDDSRGLTSGGRPDFEAYRRRLNATIAAGSHTVGQHDYWLRKEAEKQNARYSGERHLRHDRYKPWDDNGPDVVAPADAVTKSGASFRWTKERRKTRWHYGHTGDVARSIRVPYAELLHVDAYVPGDFKQFYADPRTRADYLQWAPLLLRAEDWHAKKKGAAR